MRKIDFNKTGLFLLMVIIVGCQVSPSMNHENFVNGSISLQDGTVNKSQSLVSIIHQTKENSSAIHPLQQELKDSTAILIYANSDQSNLVQMILTQNALYGQEVSRKSFLAQAESLYGQTARENFNKLRGLKLNKMKQSDSNLEQIEKGDRDAFTEIVNYYRTLITTPQRLPSDQKKSDITGVSADSFYHLSRLLYDFLILPLEEKIADKKELIIVPDGILGYLPFEVLLDGNGHYLAEKYRISYTPSLTIQEQLGKRRYSNQRQPMLAFGGAVYDNRNYDKDLLNNTQQLAYLKNNMRQAFARGSSVQSGYGLLGLDDWGNLPGTLQEVKDISKTVPGARVITGHEVSEARLKEMSAIGELAEYRVIHFATHGITVAEIPELSAVVLSQFRQDSGPEDGYLRMEEISKLRIKADFVNLSACDTGLGKIYGGEGVVGLMQSFILAGANGLSVSLWPVADHSTVLFMGNLYKLVEEEGLSYIDAMTLVKRRFMDGEFGETYRSPYYWAPFVYYGKI